MKNSQRGFIVPLLIGIIALLVLGGGSYVYLNQRSNTQTINQFENNLATTSDTSVNTQATSSVDNGNLNNKTGCKPYSSTASEGLIYPLKITSPLTNSNLTSDSFQRVQWNDISCAPDENVIAVLSETQGTGIWNISSDQSFTYIPNGILSSQENINVNLNSAQFIGPGAKRALASGTYRLSLLRTDTKITISPSLTVNISVSQNISVNGMQQYTDSNFGFSFWYPSNWIVSEKEVIDPNANGWFQSGSIVKILKVNNSNPNLQSNGVTIQEFSSPTLSITELGQTKSASPVGVDQKYYFDTSLHTWMYENLTDSPSGSRPAGTITPADVSNNTMGGLHIFPGAVRFGAESIVPLSAKNFLVISTNDPAGDIRQNPFVNTIVATDPTVATPWSTTLQTQTIQAEKTAYLGQ